MAQASPARTIDSTGRPAICAPIPRPPIIIGGFGLRMAAIAGKYGDGFKYSGPPPEPCRAGPDRARRAQGGGPDPSRFELSVFAGLAPAWLRADSENRAALERMGVARLIF